MGIIRSIQKKTDAVQLERFWGDPSLYHVLNGTRPMNRRRVRSLLIGADDRATRLGCLVAVGVFMFGLLLWAVLWGVNQANATIPITLPWLVGGLALVSLVPAIVYAYRFEGLIVCLAIGTALPLSLYLVPTASPTMPPDESVLWGVGAAFIFGFPAGTIGFLTGVGFRYLTDSNRSRSRKDTTCVK